MALQDLRFSLYEVVVTTLIALIRHIEMEVYVDANQAESIAKLIVDTAHVDADGEGLVCITPVDHLYWIHDKRAATESDFKFRE